MCTFHPAGSHKRRFRYDLPVVPLDHPAVHMKCFPRYHASPKADPQIDGQSFPVAGNDRLRHGLVQHGRDDATVNGAAKTLPPLGRSPGRIDPALSHMKLELKPLWVTCAADNAVWI